MLPSLPPHHYSSSDWPTTLDGLPLKEHELARLILGACLDWPGARLETAQVLSPEPFRGYESDLYNGLLATLMNIQRRCEELNVEIRSDMTRRLLLRAMCEGQWPDRSWSDPEREGWLESLHWPGVTRGQFKRTLHALRGYHHLQDHLLTVHAEYMRHPMTTPVEVDAHYRRLAPSIRDRKLRDLRLLKSGMVA